MWKKASNINAPLGRSSHTVSQVGGQIYVFGGEHVPRETIDNRLWAYNITTDSWNEVQANGVPPQARLAHSATVVGTDIIFYAGRVTDKTELEDMWVFHTSTNTWEEIKMVGQSPPPRSYHVMTSPPNSPYLYMFGGCKPVKGRYNDLWRFDLRSKTWEELRVPNAPSERGGPQLVSTDSALYVLFGFSGRELGDIHRYDLNQNQWTEMQLAGTAPQPRSVHCACPVNDNEIFVFGGEKEPSKQGHLGAGEYWQDAFILDTRTGIWTQVPQDAPGEWPTARGWIASTSVLNGVVIHGGFDGTDRLGDLHIYTHTTH
jgi:N-acetylneuraminic acid mutarotase